MDQKLIVALHGFLGLPSDWTAWHHEREPETHLWAINLWNDPQLNASLSLSQWTSTFVAIMSTKVKNGFSIELWGYSMGGRLALGALLAAPDLFQKAMILSANPGLEDDSERSLRSQRDHVWADKFLQNDWLSVVNEWEQQPVLLEPETVQKTIHRREKDFDRTRLAQALIHWSIAKQPYYWPKLKDLELPIEWHVGEFDKTYLGIGQRAKTLNPKINLMVHLNRGHRLLLS
jgi:2-succinyl-6-hydroxy-2,4-cyclohexadiene-1-carboxylate synthase